MCARYPVLTSMPGIAGVNPVLDLPTGTGAFLDKKGVERHFTISGQLAGADPFLSIMVDEGSLASFAPWPKPHERFWSCTGIVVAVQRVGIAKGIYAAVRDFLAPRECKVAPSDKLKEDGVALWAYLDPGIEMEPCEGGASRPKLP